MSETAIQNEIRNALAVPRVRTYRANAGKAWTGSVCKRLPNGDMLIKNPRPFIGLPADFPDLFGHITHTVTPADVGREVALFFQVEVKSDTGRLSTGQAKYQTAAKACGVRIGVARSVAEAERIVYASAPNEPR